MVTDRLPFQLPDFTRTLWVSDRAREVWQPRVNRIVSAWAVIERRSVLAGRRAAALQHVDVGGLPSFSATCARDGLVALPLALEGMPRGPYATDAGGAGEATPNAYRVAVARMADVERCRDAWLSGDQERIGELLGYPACCRAFFERIWVSERSTDTTWHMAFGTCTESAPRLIDVDGPPEGNILLRWLGVRAVPHLPCRFDCGATATLARDLLRDARDAGLATEAAWILEMLSWPMEWSALHGIAEIVTPVVKIATRTDATARRYVVRYAGHAYPAEGARGLAFPFQRAGQRTATAGAAREAVTVSVPPKPAAAFAADNGFASEAAMHAAHEPIVRLVAEHFAGRVASVFDLGCGGGALLLALRERHPGLAVGGVDADPARISRARRLLAGQSERLFEGDLCDTAAAWAGQSVDLAMVMPGRLIEAGPAGAARLREWLRARAGATLVYAYDDWLARYGGLAELTARAGLRLVGAAHNASAGLAVVPPTDGRYPVF